MCTNSHFPHVYSASFASKKRGVLIVVRNSVTFHLNQSVSDPEGRYIILVCTINKIVYTLVNIYAPNIKQMRFLCKLMHIVQPLKQGHIIICGDYNLKPEVQLDSTSATKRRESPLKNVIVTQDLFDV